MPSLKIIYDVEGWAYFHKANSLIKHAPPDFQVSALAAKTAATNVDELIGSEPVDLFVVMDCGLAPAMRAELKKRNWHSKLVVIWSNGWPFGAWEFSKVYLSADHIIVNNLGAWHGWGRLPRTTMITNGVDLETFRVTKPIETRQAKVAWAGSHLHRRTKAYDDLMVPVQQELHRRGIDCELMLVDSYGRDKRTPEQMADWYNHSTVYVCASRSEGTPNTALEAAASGCTVVSTRVGNMEQLIRDGINGRLVDANLDSIVTGVEDAIARYVSFAYEMQNDILAWDWRKQAHAHFDVFRKILREDRAPEIETGKRDLTDLVTVFVTTVGAPTFGACIARLKEQSCAHQMNVIRNIAPMSAAYQAMIDRCRTPFYVQLDEDMLLHPNAIEVLYDQMTMRGRDTAMVAAELYDCDMGRPIYGVKMFRHEIVKNYPFSNVEATDVDQNSRMTNDGYRIELLRLQDKPGSPGGVLGLHGVKYTDASGYERYAGLKRRYRRRPGPEGWFLDQELALFGRFRDDPNRQNFFALMGAVAGTLWPLNGKGEEKDWRQYAQLPGFAELNAFFERIAELNDRLDDKR